MASLNNHSVFKSVALSNASTLTSATTLYQVKDGNNDFRTYLSNNLHKGKKQSNAEFVLVMWTVDVVHTSMCSVDWCSSISSSASKDMCACLA
ncbi:calpain family cysteine protease-like protein [Leishmania tarentolae]|uniref:Calpain family cysteine protease-like protein n=1 Tax=Leishmania tarentolae TaxID=5689 RepID=A0A640KJ47_LEITA|nr:calpain family cysteine protease-like protein [Leishmania tarentolae]